MAFAFFAPREIHKILTKYLELAFEKCNLGTTKSAVGNYVRTFY